MKKSSTDYMINCYCPANGKLLGKVAPAYPEDIDNAVAKAAAAQQQWEKTSFDERKKVLRTLQKYVYIIVRCLTVLRECKINSDRSITDMSSQTRM